MVKSISLNIKILVNHFACYNFVAIARIVVRDWNVREHIMGMCNIAAQLKSLKSEISESYLVHLILFSLLSEYGPFKISCNTHKETWTLNDLLSMCVQEENRLKQEKLDSAHMFIHKEGAQSWKSAKQKKSKISHKVIKKIKCFFYKKVEDTKKECPKMKK